MIIFLFGATGETGKEVLIKLLEQKHKVIVLARNPNVLEEIKKNYNNLKIIKGDVYNKESYQEELNNCNLVISTLGTGTSRKPTKIYSKGGQDIISAMRNTNIKRLITITSAAFDPTDPVTQSFFAKYIIHPLFKHIYADMQRWETILERSEDINWTCIRPSRLVNGKERGTYRVQINHCPKNGGKISRKDLADFIVKQIDSDEYLHQKVAIAY